MIFIARKREMDRICQILVQSRILRKWQASQAFKLDPK